MLAVANQFNRAACSYDQAATLQRRVADELIAYLSTQSTPRTIIDLGCGTGYSLPLLAKRYPCASVTGVDFAFAMLEQVASAKSVLCANAANLPLANDSVDMVFSNLMLQWCSSFAVLTEIHRILTTTGYCVISTFGPNTLHELRNAWAPLDKYTHVNHFCSEHTLKDQCNSLGFHIDYWQTEQIICWYPQVVDLLHELKAIGANSVLTNKAPGLVSRQRWQKLNAIYTDQHATTRGVPATFEVFYGVLQKI